MFSPFMKNTLLVEKWRSNVHPSLHEDKCFTPFEKNTCSRMSLRRGGQMFTPFMKNTLLSEKKRLQQDVSTKANVHPFYEEYTLL